MEVLRSSHGLLSTKAAAELLGCTVQHIRLLIRRGKITGERIGREWLAVEESVKGYDRHQGDADVVSMPQVETLFSDADLQSVVNVASVPQRSPFRYPGGKTWLVPIARLWLKSLSGHEKTLLEPFAGGGGISLMAVMEGFVKEAQLIELDPEVAAVWKVAVDGGALALANRIRGFKLTVENVQSELAEIPETVLDRAFKTILHNRVSRGGILAPGAGLIKAGEAGKGIASRWYPETLARRFEEIHRHRTSLTFRESDGIEEIAKAAGNSDTAFFIDPPYPVAGRRLYRFHDLDHRALFAAISLVKGSFLATYDDNPAVKKLAAEFGFETRLVPMKSTHHRHKFELLISRSFDWMPVAADEVADQAFGGSLPRTEAV